MMCYHIVRKSGIGYIFIFPPTPLSGAVNAFLLINNEVHDALKSEFEKAWERSVPALIGGLVTGEQPADIKEAFRWH
jgi:hypothetical protein